MKKTLGLLQIFRGIAALLVVAYHLGESSQDYFSLNFLGDIFSKGYIGVDFFFVLSGFIITYVHYNDLLNSTNKIIFLKKRIIRVYPVYWVIASVYLLMLIFISKGKTNHLDHQMDFTSFKEWIHIAKCYLLIPHSYKFFLGVAWTLSYEILFYIAFFIAICIGFKRAKYIFLIWPLIILVNQLWPNILMPTSLIIFDIRIIEFLAGCLVGYLIIKSYRPANYLWYLCFIGGTIFAYQTMAHWDQKPLGILILALLNGLLLFKIVNIDIHKEYKYPKILLLTGEASYSIYLSHVIFLSLWFRIFRMVIAKLSIHNLYLVQAMIIFLFLLTVTCGIMVYKYVEKPLIKFLNAKLLKRT